MSDITKIKEIMGLENMEFSENFHMCDVSEVTEDHIHLESWNEDVSKSDFDAVAELIAQDGYDIEGFELIEIPHPKVFCFANEKTDQYFDVCKFYDDKWQFSYMADGQTQLAASVQDAIEKYKW